MIGRYLIASFFGGLIGACCVLVIVYVTNTGALAVTTNDITEAVSSLHSRINDFYIFAGIVITWLLAINVGVFIRADDEVSRHMRENADTYKQEFIDLINNTQRNENHFKDQEDDIS